MMNAKEKKAECKLHTYTCTFTQITRSVFVHLLNNYILNTQLFEFNEDIELEGNSYK